MKIIFKIGLGILAACFLLLLGYLIWLGLRAYWPAVLFFGFVALGCTFSIFDFVMGRKNLRATLQGKLIDSISGAQHPTSLVFRKLIVTCIIATGGWIYSVLIGLSSIFAKTSFSSFVQRSADVYLRGIVVKWSLVPIPLLLLCYGVLNVSPNSFYWARCFFVVIILNVIFRLVYYSFNSPPLPIVLRRTISNPIISFFVIALSDLMSLVLALKGILYGQGVVSPQNLQQFTNILSGLFFAHILDIGRDVVMGREPRVAELVTSIIGVLYSFSILETAYRFREFRRSDEDYVALAGAYNLLGRHVDALKMIGRVQNLGPYSILARALANLGVNRMDLCWEDCQRHLRMQGKNESANEIFLTLWGAMYGTPIRAAVRKNVIGEALKFEVSDLCLAIVCLGPWGDDKDESENLHKLTLNEYFDGANVRSKFQLTRAALILSEGDRAQSRIELDGLKMDKEDEVAFKQLLELIFALRDPETSKDEDRQFFDQWSEAALNTISQWALNVSISERFRVAIYGVMLVVHNYATVLESRYEQAWLFLLNQVQGKLAAELAMGDQEIERMGWSVRRSFGS